MADEAGGITTLDHSSDADQSRHPLLLQMRSDRRLGHEWDDWDGRPLPNKGRFEAGPLPYFVLAVGVALLSALVSGLTIWVVQPRLLAVHSLLPLALYAATAIALAGSLVWLALLGASLRFGSLLLPRGLAERGPLPFSMKVVEKLGLAIGMSRDMVGSSALHVYNGISTLRSASHRPDDLLLLLPRCLSRDSMRAALDLSARYGVPAFVASRGRYARQMIGERKPAAVVAVACERDLMSGIADVAGRLPVLGSTIGMPAGPCRDTELDMAALERQLLAMLKGSAGRVTRAVR